MHLIRFLALILPITKIISFNFKQLVVTADSYIINQVTTYKLQYNRREDNNFATTNYQNVPITSTDTITVTFPPQYTLTSVNCLVQVNEGATNTQTCSISGNIITVVSVFSTDTIVSTVNLWVSNVLNPTPAITTSQFSGTIGNDVAVPDGFSSIVQLQPGTFLSCAVAFTPTNVNRTSNMIITITPQNQIAATGSIVVTFPQNHWSNDLSATNYLPIAVAMTCTNQSNNVKSGIQCAGNTVENAITASNLFFFASSSQFSFSVQSFLTPPTPQPVDPIIISSFINGSQIDTCTTYVTGLTPNQLGTITILSTSGTGLTVNTPYEIRFNFSLVDTISQLDTFKVTFPTNTIMSFDQTAISSNVGFQQSSATFANNIVTLSMNNIGRLFGPGSSVIFTLGNYTAPPSIKTTDPITVQILNNGYTKMQGTTTITALSSTLSGTISLLSTVVNELTSYTFTITTVDPLSSTGKIKISIPAIIAINIGSTNCANVSGSGLTQFPTCTIDAVSNSIILTGINSSSSIIPAQTLSITITGLVNPPSTALTDSFSMTTFYQSTDDTLVATGLLDGINATVATISVANAQVTPSSFVVADASATYFFSLTVQNTIPAGGYFEVSIPFDLGVDMASVVSHCSININSTSYVATDCSVTQTNVSYVITFSNPFAADATINTNIIARVDSVFRNPLSTQPTQSFGIFTYHSDGNSIAQITSSLTVQMNTATSFNSFTIGRVGNQNYQITTYILRFSQPLPIQASGLVLVTFPSNVVPSLTSACSITLPSSSSLTCALSGSVLTITLPASQINSDTIVELRVTNVRNPASFAPTGTFSLQTKTANNLYSYSHGLSTNTLSNDIPTAFDSLTSQFSPRALDSATSLKVTFDPSDSIIVPSSLWLTLANTFIINGLSCNSFIDFTGSCTFDGHTVKVSGTFTSAPMAFSVTGFTTPTFQPTDFSSVVTFDANNYKIDESTNQILFSIGCTLPCRTCSTPTTQCLSCYSNTAITQNIYLDEQLSTCNQICVDGKYEDTVTLKCQLCDSNCATCQGSATFCQTCVLSSSFNVLYVENNATQTCVSACPSGLYIDATINPTSCTNCVAPCATCTDVTICLSCVSGTFLYNSSCLNNCPSGLTVENPVNHECDFCDALCATCSGTITTCTSCFGVKLLYLNQCIDSCPDPLVPQNGTCGACDSNCQTCVNDMFTCTSCDPASSFPFLFQTNCLNNCPDFYYNNAGSGICSLCSSVANLNCQNCSTQSTCLSCDSGFVLLNATCINFVPSGFVNISGVAQSCIGDCATCSIVTSNCTSCINNNLLNNQCLVTCPDGYVPINKQCIACSSPCATCQSTTTTCLSCLTTLNPSVFLNGNDCLQVCPDTTFANSASNTCDSCQSPCQFCTSVTVCTTCLNGFFFEDGGCPTSCKTGFTGINRVCQACQGNCQTCENETTTCLTCVAGTYLFTLNNSCVSDCGQGLYVDVLNAQCVSCQSPCKTCVNSSSTCLSCETGVLYNNNCPAECPDKFFNLSNSCQACPSNCSACTSFTVCTACINQLVLFNDFCIQTCPSTHAVVINTRCTACSDTFCHECTSADVCTSCDSDYSLLNGACLSVCPAGYSTNGTHCLQTNQQVLTAATSFPVPFSIAAAVFIIACLMSKLQFSHTFLSGAIYSLVGILQWGALGYGGYLYYLQLFPTQPFPFYIGLGAMGYLYLLNFLAIIVQNVVICPDKHFKAWNTGCNQCFNVVVNIVSLIMNHKFRNIVFSKLFTFNVFTGQLEEMKKFRVIYIFSFLSLLHSGGAIFAAVSALGHVTQNTSQLYYQCIDIIVVTGINVFMAFFNVVKGDDFFYERTNDGFQLKKKIELDDELIEDKIISPAGNDEEEQQGYISKITHIQGQNALASNAALRFYNGDKIDEESDYSFGSLLENKKYQDMSVQALEIINDKDPKNFNRYPPKLQENYQNYTVFYDNTQNKSTEKEISLIPQQSQEFKKNNPTEKLSQRTVFYNKQEKQYKQLQQKKQEQQNEQEPQKFEHFSPKKIHQKERTIQEKRAAVSQNLMYKVDPVNRSYLSRHSQMKKSQNFDEQEEEKVNDKNSKETKEQKAIIKKDNEAQIDERVQYDEINGQMASSFRTQQIIFQEEQNEQNKLENKQLNAEVKDQLMLPSNEIRNYQQQLQKKIQNKEIQLYEIKRKIESKQRKNLQKSQLLNRNGQVGKLYKKAEKTKRYEENNDQISEQIEISEDKDQRQIKYFVDENEEDIKDQEQIEEELLNENQNILYEDPEQNKLGIQSNSFKRNNPKIYQQQNDISEEKGDRSTKLQSQMRQYSKNRFKRNDPVLYGSQENDLTQEINERPFDARLIRGDMSETLGSEHQDANQTIRSVNVKKDENSTKLIRKNWSKQKNKNQQGRKKQSAQHKIHERQSSLQLAGRSKFNDKNNKKGSPSKAQQKLEYQNRNASEGEEEIPYRKFKNPHMVLPTQTDRQSTQFRYSAIKASQKNLGKGNKRISNDKTKDNQDNRKSQTSMPHMHDTKRLHVKPKDIKEQQSEQPSQQPYIEEIDDISRYRNNMILDQMLQRPDNDNLQNYYNRAQTSRKPQSKNKKSASHLNNETEKIYLQRLDKKWK